MTQEILDLNFARRRNRRSRLASKSMRRSAGALALVAVVWLAIGMAKRAEAQPFSKVIVFGDSNVDSGFYKSLVSPGGGAVYNTYWASAVAHGAGAPTTNPDPLKSQMLAAFFGLTANPSNTPGGTNYATSGAKNVTLASTQTGGFTASVPTVTQISNYLTSNGGVADPNALYLVYSGDNDVAYAIGEQGAGPYPSDPTAYVTQAATSLANAIINLKNLGAQKIIVSGLSYSFGSPVLKRTLKLTHTNTVWNALTAASVPFYRADVDTVRSAIVANPSNFGFTSVNTTTVGCTQPSGVSTAWSLLCSSDPAAPSTYVSPTSPFTSLFADDSHFGTAGQRYVARYFRSLVVPWTVRHDFYGAGTSSVLWGNSAGDAVVSNMQGAAIASTTYVANVPPPWRYVGTGDFFSDGKSSILWGNSNTGDYAVWRMSGPTIVSSNFVATVPTNFSVVAIADFDSDGKPDILWREASTNNYVISLMDGAAIKSTAFVAALPANWVAAGAGDFNGDGKADILWRNSATGDVVLSQMNGAAIASMVYVTNVPTNWQVAGVADFDGDGKADILWRDQNTGNAVLSTMNGAAITATTFVASVPNNWAVGVLGDFNGDGKTDIFWRDATSGNAVVSLMNGATTVSSTAVGSVPTAWNVQGANAN